MRAVFAHQGGRLTSEPITVTIRRPGKGDAEHEPMARLHHTPWSTYDTNAFCGDTFDFVKRWPQSRFARYCHYWNGRYLQNKKDFDKTIASYRLVIDKYPDCVLADDAEDGIVECLAAQNKLPELKARNAELKQKLQERATRAGGKTGTGQTAVQRLADETASRLSRGSGVKEHDCCPASRSLGRDENHVRRQTPRPGCRAAGADAAWQRGAAPRAYDT